MPADARRWLLQWARQSIEARLKGESSTPSGRPAQVDRLGGCFVSLHQRETGALRGCVGTFSADEPLWRQVEQMAVASATRDPRFDALQLSELESCVLEISVLSAPTAAEPEEIEVGRHGLAVQKGGRRGVLLPQVATQQGWDPTTFLAQTCVKAGLDPGAWRDGSVDIEVFSAQVFSEL